MSEDVELIHDKSDNVLSGEIKRQTVVFMEGCLVKRNAHIPLCFIGDQSVSLK